MRSDRMILDLLFFFFYQSKDYTAGFKACTWTLSDVCNKCILHYASANGTNFLMSDSYNVL